MEISEILLGASIILPPILWTALITPFLKKTRPKDAWLNVALMLNPKHGLGDQTLFWLVVLVPLTYFIIFGAITWKDYSVALNAGGFDKFIEISKLPIGLLSLSLPLTALVTYLHSTAQTAKQIEKNEHELFYLHRREFVFYFDQIGATTINDEYDIGYKIFPRIHGKLFKGDPSAGTPELDRELADKLVRELRMAERCLERVLREEFSVETSDAYLKLCKIITDQINFFSIRDLWLQIDKACYPIEFEGKQIPTLHSLGCNAAHAVAAYECVKGYLTNVLYFSGYQEGIENLFNKSVNVWRLSLEDRAKDNVKLAIAHFSNNPPDELYSK